MSDLYEMANEIIKRRECNVYIKNYISGMNRSNSHSCKEINDLRNMRALLLTNIQIANSLGFKHPLEDTYYNLSFIGL